MTKSNCVICITTFNRIDCARINMEIIKLNYTNQWPIVHACSDKNYTQYIEDILVPCEPKALQKGALELLKQSILAAHEKYNPEFIIHLEADTWLMNQNIIEKYIKILHERKDSVIAASSWSFDKTYKWKISNKPHKRIFYFLSIITKIIGLDWHIGWKRTMATQFFILKNTKEFRAMINEIPEPDPNGYLEKFLFKKVIQKFGKKSIVKMNEREPVHPNNRVICEKMELYSQHFPTNKLSKNSNILDVEGKKQTLERYLHLKKGLHMNKLLESKNLDYYNEGARRY